MYAGGLSTDLSELDANRNEEVRIIAIAAKNNTKNRTRRVDNPLEMLDIEFPCGSRPGRHTCGVEGFEREVIVAELKRAGFHMTNAAKALGLERSHLYKKAEQLGIDIQKARREGED